MRRGGASRTTAKGNLPTKPCEHCKRPMAWRKKWARDWENVRYCSKRCAGEARRVRDGARPS